MIKKYDRKKNNSSSRYSSYTYNSSNILVRFPHMKRNKLISSIIESYHPEAWLDYGSGDGELANVIDDNYTLPSKVVLYEPVEAMFMELKKNLQPLADKVKITDNQSEILKHKFDVVSILEVLEHLPLTERINFYILLSRIINKGGKCIIEVPIEFGPILLIKEFGRKFFKHRVSKYSIKELFFAIFGKIEDTHNRYDLTDDRTFISPHHGFDLDKLLSELSMLGIYKQLACSPFLFLPKALNQVVIIEFEIKVFEKNEIINKINKLYQ